MTIIIDIIKDNYECKNTRFYLNKSGLYCIMFKRGVCMFEYIVGLVTSVTNNYIVLENNGIGYLVNVSNPYYYNIDKEYKLYIHQHVREDQNILFGFNNKKIKDIFLLLLNVNGIGPKSALSITSIDNVDEIIGNIEIGNYKYFKQFPGIGEKTSQQIILDLKGKLVVSNKLDDNKNIKTLEEGLINLGYKKNEISKVLDKIVEKNDLNKMFQEALKLLVRKVN